MAFLSDLFGRMGRVARGEANQGVGAIEDATFEATVNQTVADMKNDLNNVVRASAVAMSNYNRLDAEYQKYVRQSQEWKDRAGMALDAGNEDLARKALAKKAESDEQVASMKQAVDSAQADQREAEAAGHGAEAQDRRRRAHGHHPGGAQERRRGATQGVGSHGGRGERRQRVFRAGPV